jgi:hypothetical protein
MVKDVVSGAHAVRLQAGPRCRAMAFHGNRSSFCPLSEQVLRNFPERRQQTLSCRTAEFREIDSEASRELQLVFEPDFL